jgi:multiple sugar transport system permease protein
LKHEPVALQGLIFVGMLLIAVLCTFPVLYLINNSLKTLNEYYRNPLSVKTRGFQFSNYVTMISQFRILRYFWNTFFILVCSCALLAPCSIIASYAYSKLRFRGKNLLYTIIIATMLIPAQVTIIPLYVLFSRVNLINNPWSVILLNFAQMLPGNVLLLTTYFKSIPDEIIDACRIDGGGYFHIIQHVVVPMGITAIVVQIIFNSRAVWDDFLCPLILLQKDNVKTIMPALASLSQRYVADEPYLYSGLVLGLLPTLCIFIVGQRYIIRGLYLGAIK